MKYDVDYFIKKFEAIPNKKWCVGKYIKYRQGMEKKCALGHCGTYGDVTTAEAGELSYLFEDIPASVIDVNDGKNPSYKQKTPKGRVLAALYHIKNKYE